MKWERVWNYSPRDGTEPAIRYKYKNNCPCLTGRLSHGAGLTRPSATKSGPALLSSTERRRRMRILIPILFALLAFPAAIAGAQEPPSTCDPSQRGTSGDITTPCVITPEFEVEKVEHRFTPVSHLEESKTYCDCDVVVTLAEGAILPPQFRYTISGNWGGVGQDQSTNELVVSGVDVGLTRTPLQWVRWDGYLDMFIARESGSVPGSFSVGVAPTREDRHRWVHHERWIHGLTMPVDEFYSWESRALTCQAEAQQGHLTLKHAAAEAAREAAQASQNAIAETAAAEEEERAKVTAATSERIDAARLESEKRVTATEARELVVVEGMIQASINVAAEITQIRIDRATARLESLERTQTWLRDAAATDLDEWNTYYAEVEQAAIERVEALQVEAAAALKEVQQIQDSLAQDLAASQARQQALTLQLQSQGGVSIEDLQILRQNAVDWVETIDGLIEEAKAESAGE